MSYHLGTTKSTLCNDDRGKTFSGNHTDTKFLGTYDATTTFRGQYIGCDLRIPMQQGATFVYDSLYIVDSALDMTVLATWPKRSW